VLKVGRRVLTNGGKKTRCEKKVSNRERLLLGRTNFRRLMKTGGDVWHPMLGGRGGGLIVSKEKKTHNENKSTFLTARIKKDFMSKNYSVCGFKGKKGWQKKKKTKKKPKKKKKKPKKTKKKKRKETKRKTDSFSSWKKRAITPAGPVFLKGSCLGIWGERTSFILSNVILHADRGKGFP